MFGAVGTAAFRPPRRPQNHGYREPPDRLAAVTYGARSIRAAAFGFRTLLRP